MNDMSIPAHPKQVLDKFQDPDWTARGERRAVVGLIGVKTLWFNTGTLCNIECVNCYIESSPTNDRLVYISLDDVKDYLDQVSGRGWPTTEIGFTGGEPFMNPEMIDILEESLSRGYEVLVLTNAMKPMMRPAIQQGLLRLHQQYGSQLTLRISLDHYTEAYHDEERGEGAYQKALTGMRWLSGHGFNLHVAGRTMWDESPQAGRAGYAALFAQEGFAIDANDPAACLLFPEMDETVDVPEITTECWRILGKAPASVMCATSRMVVKRKGAKQPSVVACTLLAYDSAFDTGPGLEAAEKPVKLNHPHCAKFCVLGGASCAG